jgi:hypothetical protein
MDRKLGLCAESYCIKARLSTGHINRGKFLEARQRDVITCSASCKTAMQKTEICFSSSSLGHFYDATLKIAASLLLMLVLRPCHLCSSQIHSLRIVMPKAAHRLKLLMAVSLKRCTCLEQKDSLLRASIQYDWRLAKDGSTPCMTF